METFITVTLVIVFGPVLLPIIISAAKDIKDQQQEISAAVSKTIKTSVSVVSDSVNLIDDVVKELDEALKDAKVTKSQSSNNTQTV